LISFFGIYCSGQINNVNIEKIIFVRATLVAIVRASCSGISLDNLKKCRHNFSQQLFYKVVNLKAPETGEESEAMERGGN